MTNMCYENENTIIDIGSESLTQEQRNDVIDKTWSGLKSWLQKNWNNIESGNITAADIGGAIYGITASVILMIVDPIKGDALLKTILGTSFVAIAEKQGRYWGTSVDWLIEVIKGESAHNQEQIVGILATVYIAGNFLSGSDIVLELFNTSAWSLTVEIGKKVGGAVADAVEEVYEVVKDVVDAVEDVAEEFVDWITGLF